MTTNSNPQRPRVSHYSIDWSPLEKAIQLGSVKTLLTAGAKHDALVTESTSVYLATRQISERLGNDRKSLLDAALRTRDQEVQRVESEQATRLAQNQGLKSQGEGRIKSDAGLKLVQAQKDKADKLHISQLALSDINRSTTSHYYFADVGASVLRFLERPGATSAETATHKELKDLVRLREETVSRRNDIPFHNSKLVKEPQAIGGVTSAGRLRQVFEEAGNDWKRRSGMEGGVLGLFFPYILPPRANRNYRHNLEEIILTIDQVVQRTLKATITRINEYNRQLEEQHELLTRTIQSESDNLIRDNTTKHERLASKIKADHATLVKSLGNRYDKQVREVKHEFAVQTKYLQALLANWNASFQQRVKSYTSKVKTGVTIPLGNSQSFAAKVDSWAPTELLLPYVALGTSANLPVGGSGNRVVFPAIVDLPTGLSTMVSSAEPTGAQIPESTLMSLTLAFPPGKLRMTLIDPVGNGSNFAGLMHLGTSNPALIGDGAWVDARHIEEHLAELSEQMRTIIQKYLKRDFETMEEYNEAAQQIEEPYRLLVINNFPTGFSQNAITNLRHILSNGRRAGIYTMIGLDRSAELPRGFSVSEIESAVSRVATVSSKSLSMTIPGTKYLSRFAPPPELPNSALKTILERISEESLTAANVVVPFADVMAAKKDWWTGDSRESLSPVIGFHGARVPQRVNFGRNALGGDLNNGALIVGRVGSGKSTLLHSIIMGLATQYSPEELELYLIDSKQGIEFNTYARYQLPHAKAISVETEPEFTASVILRLAAEMEIRAAKFKDSLGESESARNISRYREVTGNPMPRIVLVIDEFQELYREDSARIREAQNALEQLIRQGRAYGIHLILATQTFGGGVGMPKSIRELVAVRISLMTSEADAAMIFQDDNTEARLLDRPGEAILNESFGRVESNQRFQTAWMESEERDEMLIQLRNRADSQHLGEQRPIVFIGGVSSDLASNPAISNDDLDHKSPKVWLGSTIAIEPDYEVNLRQLSGANVLIVGKHEDTRGVVVSAAVSVLATSPTAVMRIVDAGGEDTEISDHFDALTELHGRDVRVVTQRGTPAILEEVHGELLQRLELDSARGLPPIVLILPVIDRIRSIRRDPTSMNSYAIDEFNPVKAFGQILAEGSEVGIHVIAQSDSLGSLNKVMNSQLIDQFDTRVVTQVSTEDSTRLIDNREAGNLGPNRAIVFQDDRNSRVKIKPYGVPNLAWMRSILSETEPVNTGVPV